MTDQLTCYAASEARVHSLIGAGLRDADLAERQWRWAQRFGADPDDQRWDLLSLSTRTLLWAGDPALPFDGHPDGYWHGLEAIVASRASAVIAPVGLGVAHDLDVALAEAGADESLLPTSLSHRFDAGLPEPEYVDVRVLGHDDAVALAQFRAGTDESGDAFTEFLATFTRPGHEADDLWLFSPGMSVLVRRPGGEPPTLADLESRP